MKLYERIHVISFYFECRMENREQANQKDEMMNEELVVVDECEEEASDAPSASAGIGLIDFLL